MPRLFLRFHPDQRRVWAIVLLPLMGFAALTGWFFCRSAPREPVYGGKSLSQLLYDGDEDFIWIPNDVYGHIHDELWSRLTTSTGKALSSAEGPGSKSGAADAADGAQVGTNALPWLIQWMGRQPGRWDAIREWVGDHLPSRLGNWVSPSRGYVWGERHMRWHIAAFEGFTDLGTNAEPALPALSNLLVRTGGDLPLTWAMANIGPKGIAVLTNVLTTTNANLRDNAALALGLQYKRARPALPALVACVERQQASYHVLGAIGRIGGKEPRLVPALVNVLTATNLPPGAARDDSMVFLVLGLQRERARAAIPALLARYKAAPPAGADATRRLLRRVLRNISPAAERQLPAPGPGETSDDWP